MRKNWEFLKIRGSVLGFSNSKDYSILGPI